MSVFLNLLGEFGLNNYFLFCVFVYLAIIFLGNIVSFIALWIGVEFNFSVFHFLIILILTYLGDISGDILWFRAGKILKGTGFGYFILRRAGNYNGKFEEIINNKGIKWFVFSKFFYGSSPPVAFSLGWSGIDFKKFLKASLVTTIFWLPVLFGISFGLIFGLIPLRMINYFQKFEWVFVLGLILFISFEFLISKIIKKIIFPKLKFLSSNSENKDKE